MRLLPQERLLTTLLARGAADAADLRRVARRIATFSIVQKVWQSMI